MPWCELGPLNRRDLLHIAVNLRALDREEIFATRHSEDIGVLVNDCMVVGTAPSSYTVIAYFDNEPVAVLGACQPWPGLFDVWCFGTDEFDKIAMFLTKHVHRKMIPLLLARGAHRAHCRSMAGHTKAHDWLRSLGARQEDERVLRGWGKGGQNFILFEWHRDVMLQTHKIAEAA